MSIFGMDQHTGKRISGMALIHQDVTRAVITPYSSCVLNREFGSFVFEKIDHPGNKANLLKLYSSCVEAILRWVPAIIPTRIQPQQSDVANGAFSLLISGITTIDIDNLTAGSSIDLTIPMVA